MGVIETDQQQRRLKRKKHGWEQLCNPRVLKIVLRTGMVIYRILRLVYEIYNRFSG